MEFVNRLSSEELIDLLNYVFKNTDNSRVDTIMLKNESGRKDQNAKRYYFIDAYHKIGNEHICGLRLTDTYLYEMNFLNGRVAVDYSKDLHDYLTTKFGSEYVNYLYDYMFAEVQEETNRLMSIVNNNTKIK